METVLSARRRSNWAIAPVSYPLEWRLLNFVGLVQVRRLPVREADRRVWKDKPNAADDISAYRSGAYSELEAV